jgi:hypothetical protein
MAEETPSIDPADSPAPAVPKADKPTAPDPFLDAQLRAATAPKASASPVYSGETFARSRSGIGFFTALSLSIAASFGGAALTLGALSQPNWLRSFGLEALIPPALGALDDTKAQVSDVKARLAALEARQKTAVQTGGVATAGSPEINTGLADELKGVSGRVTAIETRLAALDPTGAGGAIIAGLQAEIASLKVMVQALQTQASAAPSAGVTFAVVTLVEAANRPGPFWPEFETVRAALPGVSEVDALEPFARTGVPTRGLLQERFAALPAALAASTQNAAKPNGFWGWLKAFFADMIKVERVTTASDTSADASLLRAKINLDQGDLAAALEEVKAISPAPDAITQWVKGAQDRLTLESRLAAVRGAVERGTRAPQPIATPTPTPKAPAPVVAAPANPSAVQRATP